MVRKERSRRTEEELPELNSGYTIHNCPGEGLSNALQVDILEVDLTLPAEKVHEVADIAVAHANAAVSELRRLFLIEDFIDSLKFSVGLWCLTYVGSWFNGMTLIIIGVIALFTLPKVYETNKAQIDQNLALVQGKINELTAKIKAAIPLGKKAEPTKEE
ncbi:hypothetical protein G9C98_007166 [Cotesia typhae]|uniref:Reticulon-like protein n=1 Tax=Cotesia typhae TaxID=2053667 RepID=A0A8J5R4U7_9HYME|nr:hypothetical protein G9C98_007166 [Cotesia typhae]